MRGRSIKLSPSRRLVCDLMRFSKSVPRVAVQRRMNLAPLAQARSSAVRRVSWTALMAKGYALLALDVPELRRAYIKLPWPQLYEYQSSVASIAHERDLEGERSVLVNLVKQPERRSVVGLELADCPGPLTPGARGQGFQAGAAVCPPAGPGALAVDVARAEYRPAAGKPVRHLPALRLFRVGR